MISKFCRLVLRIFGWKVTGKFPYHIPKKVLIVAPHTSNWDFLIGILVKISLETDIKFIGKHTLFKPPFGWFMRRLGGIPIDRTKNTNFVQAIVDEFNKKDEFCIVLAPEGTRKKVSKFKSGYYYIAKMAGIPIIPVKFDYARKEVDFGAPFYTGDDTEKDRAEIQEYFQGIRGYHPKLGI